MALKTLPWCPQPGYTVDEEPKRKVLNFGNGYQQRMEDGINALLRKYFKDVALNGELVKVVCVKFPRQIGLTHTTFNCEFEEVV